MLLSTESGSQPGGGDPLSIPVIPISPYAFIANKKSSQFLLTVRVIHFIKEAIEVDVVTHLSMRHWPQASYCYQNGT